MQQALESLEEELDRQIYPDGFQYELTTNYHDVGIKFLGENPGACPWDEAKKYFSKSLMSKSSEYTLQS